MEHFTALVKWCVLDFAECVFLCFTYFNYFINPIYQLHNIARLGLQQDINLILRNNSDTLTGRGVKDVLADYCRHSRRG